MKIHAVAAVAALALAPIAAQAQSATREVQVSKGEGKIGAAQLVEIEATIRSIDLATRTVVLAGEEGREVSVVAGPEVKRLADLKVGDEVSIQYYESLTLELSRVEGAGPAAAAAGAELRAEPTELPGGIQTSEITISAKVTAVDAAASTVTLIGPRGRSVTLEVEKDVLARLAVGDLVNAKYTEAVAVSVSRAAN